MIALSTQQQRNMKSNSLLTCRLCKLNVVSFSDFPIFCDIVLLLIRVLDALWATLSRKPKV